LRKTRINRNGRRGKAGKARRVQRAAQQTALDRVVVRPAAGPEHAADPGPAAAAQADGPRRDTRFQPGNRASVQHLIYSERLPPGLEHLPALLDRFHAAQLADEGEEADRIPARRRSLLDTRTYIVQRNILKLAHALEVRGLVDSKGKLRTQWLQMLATYIDKAIRLDSLLGLQRRARNVKQSTREWLLSDHDPSEPVDHTDPSDPDINTEGPVHGESHESAR
jgi:hypothetical protein